MSTTEITRPRQAARCSVALLALGLPLLLAPVPAAGATHTDPNAWCGTRPSRLAEELAEHRFNGARSARERGGSQAAAASPAAAAGQEGDVAWLIDDGTLIPAPNPFDLGDTGLAVTPTAKGIVVARGSAELAPERGTRLDLGDDTSQLVAFPKGFRFKFFGKTYQSVYVNSDGNLTFGAPDFESTERDVGRFLSGPPRIAPFFADLDPSVAGDEGGVFLLASKSKVVFTWQAVPQFGSRNSNTFQVTLFKNGSIAIAYGSIESRAAVVGIAPGGGGQLRLLDYSAELPTPASTSALAERFSIDTSPDELAIASAFFQEFADDYDQLIIWLDSRASIGRFAFAFEFAVKNEVKGIGLPVFDVSGSAGSQGRLRSVVEMGWIGNFPDSPDQEFLGTNSTMDVLGQESGHRWLAFLTFKRGNQVSTDLLGRSFSHWSFDFDSDASDMEGNDLRDNGDGTFTSVAATDGYSALDEYAMGLIPASEVPPMFYVADSDIAAEAAPAVGATFHGRRVDLEISDIVAAEGPRVPPSSTAQKDFKHAFVVVSQGGPPSAATLAKVDAIRRRWVDYWSEAVDFRGSIDTTLRPR